MEQIVLFVILFAIIILTIAGIWRTYEKAGQPGWAVLVPIYNLYILTKIIGKPGYWTLLMMLPYVSIIWSIWGTNLLSKKFGKDELFTVGLIFLPFICYPILGFGSAKYASVKPVSDDVLDA